MESEPKGGPDDELLPGIEPASCLNCLGRGFTRRPDASGNYDQDECPECHGAGEVNDDSGGNIGVVKHCPWCGGTGIYQGKDTNDVGPCPFCWEEG